MTEDEEYVLGALDQAFVRLGSAFGLLDDADIDSLLNVAQDAIEIARERLRGE